MRIPDCRTDKFYNEKNLNQPDAIYVTGFDACVEDCIENVFDNIDIFDEEMEAAGIDVDDIDYEILDGEKFIAEMSEEEIAKMSPSTRILKAMKDALVQYAEMTRDETITSLIDAMEEKDLEKNMKGVADGTYKNAVVEMQEFEEKLANGEIPTCWEIKKDEDGKVIRIGRCPNGDQVIEEDEEAE